MDKIKELHGRVKKLESDGGFEQQKCEALYLKLNKYTSDEIQELEKRVARLECTTVDLGTIQRWLQASILITLLAGALAVIRMMLNI